MSKLFRYLNFLIPIWFLIITIRRTLVFCKWIIWGLYYTFKSSSLSYIVFHIIKCSRSFLLHQHRFILMNVAGILRINLFFCFFNNSTLSVSIYDIIYFLSIQITLFLSISCKQILQFSIFYTKHIFTFLHLWEFRYGSSS